jgi:hypothetical protein
LLAKEACLFEAIFILILPLLVAEQRQERIKIIIKTRHEQRSKASSSPCFLEEGEVAGAKVKTKNASFASKGREPLKKNKIFFFMPLGACSSSCYKQAKAKHKKNKILFFMAPLVIPLLVPRFYYYFYPLPATFKTNFVFKNASSRGKGNKNINKNASQNKRQENKQRIIFFNIKLGGGSLRPFSINFTSRLSHHYFYL